MELSVVVPSRERAETLRRLLESLAAQRVDGPWSVVVVDDGSSYAEVEPPPALVGRLGHLPVAARGASAARNAGAEHRPADLLVFVDDDVTLAPGALEELARPFRAGAGRLLLMAQVEQRDPESGEAPGDDEPPASHREPSARVAEREVPYTHCNSQVLAVRWQEFAALGGFRAPNPGVADWDDVELGFRAARDGFRIAVCPAARAFHWDHALADLARACRRAHRVGESARRLLEWHPAIAPALPMLEDKLPIRWGADAPTLIARKLLRRIESSRAAWPVLAAAARASAAVGGGRGARPGAAGERLCTWTLGACVYRGLHGLTPVRFERVAGLRVPPGRQRRTSDERC